MLSHGISTSLKALLLTVLLPAAVSCISYQKVPDEFNANPEANATLVVMAFPETVCNTTEGGYSKLLPYIGIGSKGRVRAGHACIALVKNGGDKFEYFDNGRYTSPVGYCRVRGSNTDPELSMVVKPVWKGDSLANVPELLDWLFHNQDKTHSEGTLYASVCKDVSYENTKEYIRMLQDAGVIEYGPFAKDGTNCARFVTNAVYNAVIGKKAKKKIRSLNFFTPSGLANVRKANSYDFYYIADSAGVRTSDADLKSVQRGILFDRGKGHTPFSTAGTLEPPTSPKPTPGCQWLGGIGYGSWFDIVRNKANANRSYTITYYNGKGRRIFSGIFKADRAAALREPLKISYPSNYQVVTVITADGDTVTLRKVSPASSGPHPAA